MTEILKGYRGQEFHINDIVTVRKSKAGYDDSCYMHNPRIYNFFRKLVKLKPIEPYMKCPAFCGFNEAKISVILINGEYINMYFNSDDEMLDVYYKINNYMNSILSTQILD